MAKQIEGIIKTTKNYLYKETDWTRIDVGAFVNGIAIANADVTCSISNNKSAEFKPVSGKTDENGYFTTLFRGLEKGYYDVLIQISHSAFLSRSLSVVFLVVDKPVKYSEPHTLYLGFIERKKLDLITILSNYLDNDSDFYIPSGSSDRITYLTDWNFDVKDFPLIISGEGSLSYKRAGITNAMDSITDGGFIDISFEINVVTENKTILDRLIEKCVFILGVNNFMDLYAYSGINVQGIDVGNVATQEYAAKMLYAKKINLKSIVELAQNRKYFDIIEQIETESNYM